MLYQIYNMPGAEDSGQANYRPDINATYPPCSIPKQPSHGPIEDSDCTYKNPHCWSVKGRSGGFVGVWRADHACSLGFSRPLCSVWCLRRWKSLHYRCTNSEVASKLTTFYIGNPLSNHPETVWNHTFNVKLHNWKNTPLPSGYRSNMITIL